MKCRCDEKTLVKFADGRLSPDKAREVMEHIDECAVCREKYREILVLKEAFQCAPEIKESGDFGLKLEKMLEEAIAEGGAGESVFIPRVSRVPALAKAFVLAGLLLAAVLTGVYYAVPGKPIITGITGTSFILNIKTGVWDALSPDAVIKKGDIIRTGPGSGLDLALSGKYYMRLKENTTIKIAKLTPKYRKGEFRADLKNGDVLIDVEGPFKRSSFNIDTTLANVRVTGTKFMVTSAEITGTTWVGVLEGEVNVKALKEVAGPREVQVVSGMKTIVSPETLMEPTPLLADEWRQISELYMIGRKTRVALLITSGRNRVLELLSPCAIYISDEEPRTIPEDLEEALDIIKLAIDRRDRGLHIKGIEKLEGIVESDPSAEYNVQLSLFIGAYYHLVGMDDEAVATFDRIVRQYPKSRLVPLAECAKAYIYEEYLNDPQKAQEIYAFIIKKYPSSPDAEFAMGRLKDQ